MPLKDRTERIRPHVHGAPCSMGEVFRNNLHDAEEISLLNSLLFEEGKDGTLIWKELRAAGYEVARSTVNIHRKGECRCFNIDKDIWCLECRRNADSCVCS